MHKTRDAIAKYGNERIERKELGWHRENQWKQTDTAVCSNKQKVDLTSISAIMAESDRLSCFKKHLCHISACKAYVAVGLIRFIKHKRYRSKMS